jgi:hypothetical protein
LCIEKVKEKKREGDLLLFFFGAKAKVVFSIKVGGGEGAEEGGQGRRERGGGDIS